ncbi:orphan sodium- and chloride-dependent neurotransmitter transporter NTT5 isoform X7 [Ciconia boyciana]|uniref:orphan sodium- and chloride-dependent neurotransmitter transporter NTT5 isoform X7 n=1 Tax=Ciconia boyciana TaxID=52775 RepID=UPI003B9E993F
MVMVKLRHQGAPAPGFRAAPPEGGWAAERGVRGRRLWAARRVPSRPRPSRLMQPVVARRTPPAMQKDQPALGGDTGTLQEEPPPRPAWTSKAQYILAQLGFSVGLGNVWRFPYLCHQNGGGAFLLLYLLLLFLLGIPLLFLELAAGQCLRQGSVGVWRTISPRLAGIGLASCLVCVFVALYYNVIIAWSLLYLARSFQHPLPWQSCPSAGPNHTEPECALSSPTTYFWYRQTLDVTPEMGVGGGLQPALVGGLLGAWALVGASLLKGIKSSGKVLYVSTLFPYLVLFCLLVRGLLLEGAVEGVRIMFTPKVSAWGTGQAWRQAATQVFFALGLGFGSVIAYASYGTRRSNCHRDAVLVASLNALTSLLATLVVFAVLGARATRRTRHCLHRNAELLSRALAVGGLPETARPPGNLTALPAPQYSAWLRGLPPALRDALGITDCRLEEEMNKGVEGPGLAFIVFTETLTLLPVAPLWSSLFFLTLLGLGLGTMLGIVQAVLTPLLDTFPVLRRHRALLTVLCCTGGFVLGLPFTQRSGSYLVAAFDDYVATLPLLSVAACEAVAVAWVYGAERFLAAVWEVTGHRPWRLYGLLWRFGSPGAMVALLGASLGQLALRPPTYQAWDRATALSRDFSPPLHGTGARSAAAPSSRSPSLAAGVT